MSVHLSEESECVPGIMVSLDLAAAVSRWSLLLYLNMLTCVKGEKKVGGVVSWLLKATCYMYLRTDPFGQSHVLNRQSD